MATTQQVRPKILLRYGRQNQPIRVPIYDILVDPTAQTYLIADATVTSSSLSVANITNFAAGQPLLIGDPGNGNSEVVYVSSVTSPSTITLTGTTKYAHTASTPVSVMYFDQIQFFTAATTTGNKTQLGSNASIVANQQWTEYNDTSGSTGYYYARFRNSTGSTVSTYSDPAPVQSYTILSARSIIDSALNMINKETNSVFTDEYAFQMIDACQMEVLREFKRWSFMQSFQTIIGTTATGTFKIAVPDDLDDQLTYKSIWLFRIGREFDMVWVDKAEFDALMQGTAWSTTTVAASLGAFAVTLNSSKDFTEQGAVQIGSQSYTFTANDQTTGVLTLSTALVENISANQDVFQFASLGYPTYWTIYQGYIYHWPITGPDYSGRNYWLDYYKKLTLVTADSQEIVLPDPTVVQYYLAWKFLLRMNNGEETPASLGFYKNFIMRRDKMKQKESPNRNFILGPDLNGYGYY